MSMILEWGRKYISLNWSIIPICRATSPTTCDTPWGVHLKLHKVGKTPKIEWGEFQKRRATEVELKEWLKKWPNMNLGIITGLISSLAVVDLDGIEGRRFAIINPWLYSTVISKTGNGKQVFYKWQSGIKNSVKKIAPGVDIRGEGGFVVVAPSTHPSGRMYRWERFVPDLIPSFPTGIINALNVEPQPVNRKEDGGKTHGRLDISKALEAMKNGNIDDTLVSVLGSFRRNNYSAADVYTLLKPHAEAKGATPGHLEEKIKNIWERYEPKSSISGFDRFSLGSGNQGVLSIKSPTNEHDFEQFESSILGDHESMHKITTGFPTLDRYFEGGLKSERPFVIAARTGVGKTNVAITLSRNLCEQGKKVLFFSTEFRYEKIWARYIATLKDTNRFREHQFYVCDGFTPAIEQVESAIKQIQPDVFIFDFIQHIGKEKEILTLFMNGCAFLQRQYNCQAVILAQLNRQADFVENGKRVEPRLSMVEGSSTIEQSASRVLLLSETRVTPEYNEIEAILAKNDTGDKGMFKFALYKNPYRIEELL